MLFSTHIVSDLERVANRVVIVREGDIAWAGELDTLKETVVRLHVDGRHALPAALGLDHVIRQQVAGTRASIIASHWHPGLKGELERRLDAEISVEQMGLEDIFVELLYSMADCRCATVEHHTRGTAGHGRQHLGDVSAAAGWAGEVGRFFKTLALESLFLLLWVFIAASQTSLWLSTILLALAIAVVPVRALLTALFIVRHEWAALFLLALCGWAAFAAWYLRAPRIGVLNWAEERQPDLLHHFQGRGGAAVSNRAAAIRYQLLGEPSVVTAALLHYIAGIRKSGLT